MEIHQIETAQLHCNKTIKPFPWAAYQWAQCWHMLARYWVQCFSETHEVTRTVNVYVDVPVYSHCYLHRRFTGDPLIWVSPPFFWMPAQGTHQIPKCSPLNKRTGTCNREHMNYCERINDNVRVTHTCIDLQPPLQKSWDILTRMTKTECDKLLILSDTQYTHLETIQRQYI